jgi:hypothetical protein
MSGRQPANVPTLPAKDSLAGVVADARRECFQVRRVVDAPVERQSQVTRQRHDLERRHGHGTVGAMKRKVSFYEADAGRGEHHPFAQQYRVNAKQLAWRGPEKNECRNGGESGSP